MKITLTVELSAPDTRSPGRRFACTPFQASPALDRLVAGVATVMTANGYQRLDSAGADANVVLHAIDASAPQPHLRQAAATFVIAVTELPRPPEDVLRAGYPLLVRSLANLAVMVSDTPTGLAVWIVSLEQGVHGIGPGLTDDEIARRVFARIEPLASSRLVIANDFVPDLPPHLWGGDEQTAQMSRAARRLDTLGLLPAPFPIENVLGPRDLRHVKLLFGIGGMSYGNLSARYRGDDLDGVPDPGGPVFWMSASGVDKADLRNVGEDILLVRGCDPDRDAMVLSVPAGIKPRRVSVDAIEHWMIYREHPGVGAIVHVHGWIDGTPSTKIAYPCGTLELAESVADLVREAPDPARAVIGMRNHGITITGDSLDEIFDRVGAKIVPRVPMESDPASDATEE